MKAAEEAAGLSLDLLTNTDSDATIVEGIERKIRELLDFAVTMRSKHRDATFKLACALADFVDVHRLKEDDR